MNIPWNIWAAIVVAILAVVGDKILPFIQGLGAGGLSKVGSWFSSSDPTVTAEQAFEAQIVLSKYIVTQQDDPPYKAIIAGVKTLVAELP